MSTRPMSDEELQKEAERWDSKKADPREWKDAPESVPRAGESVQISLRVPKKMLQILREFARRQEIGYQVLMKRWLDERIRKERDELLEERRTIVLEHPVVVRKAASFEYDPKDQVA